MECSIIDYSKYPQKIFFEAGEIIISKSPQHIWTILGSCVSIIFYSKRIKTGGICHPKLPEQFGKTIRCSDHFPKPCGINTPRRNFRYITCAFGYMYEKFIEMGAFKNEIKISLIGGSSILNLENKSHSIGNKNIQAAKKIITARGMKISNSDTGGTLGRTIDFFTDIGKIKIRNHKNINTI